MSKATRQSHNHNKLTISRLFSHAIQKCVGTEIQAAVADRRAGVEEAVVAVEIEVGEFFEFGGAAQDEEAALAGEGEDFIAGRYSGDIFAAAVVEAVLDDGFAVGDRKPMEHAVDPAQ